MLKQLDRVPLIFFITGALLMGGAPFVPQPHLLEKLGMLAEGTLSRPIDIFDLCWHGLFPVLLLIKLWRIRAISQKKALKK